jgi:DNA-binding response OmpR family regulator
VLFEISKERSADVDLIMRIKQQFPDTIIIAIDGGRNQEVIAQAFSYGAKDAFRKPYKQALMVERVQALLSHAS